MFKKESPSVSQDVFTQHLCTHPTVVGKIKNAVMLLWNILLHIYCFYEPLFSGITKIYKISIVFPGWNLAQKCYKSDLCSCSGSFLSCWWGRQEPGMCPPRRRPWWWVRAIVLEPTTVPLPDISCSRLSGRNGRSQHQKCPISRGRKGNVNFVLLDSLNSGVSNKLFNVTAPQSAVDFTP